MLHSLLNILLLFLSLQSCERSARGYSSDHYPCPLCLFCVSSCIPSKCWAFGAQSQWAESVLDRISFGLTTSSLSIPPASGASLSSSLNSGNWLWMWKSSFPCSVFSGVRIPLYQPLWSFMTSLWDLSDSQTSFWHRHVGRVHLETFTKCRIKLVVPYGLFK